MYVNVISIKKSFNWYVIRLRVIHIQISTSNHMLLFFARYYIAASVHPHLIAEKYSQNNSQVTTIINKLRIMTYTQYNLIIYNLISSFSDDDYIINNNKSSSASSWHKFTYISLVSRPKCRVLFVHSFYHNLIMVTMTVA